jgi:hypothetical protein
MTDRHCKLGSESKQTLVHDLISIANLQLLWNISAKMPSCFSFGSNNDLWFT